jgi:hypothetical protein
MRLGSVIAPTNLGSGRCRVLVASLEQVLIAVECFQCSRLQLVLRGKLPLKDY